LPRFILLLLVLGIIFYVLYRYRKLDAHKKKQLLSFSILAGLGCLLVVLALTGRLSWLFAAVGALLPLIPRGARFFMGVWPALKPYFQRYQQNRQSNMHTRFLHVQIDMLSGQLRGEVLEGEFVGQTLQSLSLEQLQLLLQKYQQHDAESAALLAAYLNRQHSGWAAEGDGAGAHSSYEQAAAGAEMNVQQARDVLGVPDSATKKEIIKAHKRLMQKLHPDRGGSDFLAQQINRARDVLLKGL
jgi:DnaJ-like protein